MADGAGVAGRGLSLGETDGDGLGEGDGLGDRVGDGLGLTMTDGLGVVPGEMGPRMRSAISPTTSAATTAAATTAAAANPRAGVAHGAIGPVKRAHHPIAGSGAASTAAWMRAARSTGGPERWPEANAWSCSAMRVQHRVPAVELVRPVRVADHRSTSGASAGRRRSRPRRRWVFTVLSGRPVVSAISASDSSPKKRSATVSR